MKTAFEGEMEVWRKEGRIRRLWAGDKSLWTATDEDKWGGWLTVVEQELADIDRLRSFAAEVTKRGFTDIVLLGMGGSSLGPEVLAESFGQQAGGPRFQMMAPVVANEVLNQNNWPFGAALSFMLMIVTLLLTVIANVVVVRRYAH